MVRDYYLVRSGRLSRRENTVYIEFPNGEKKTIPVEDIRSLHVFGEMDFNAKLLNFLSQKGIPVHIYNYYGYYSGSFYPREKLVSGFLIVKQVEHYLDPEKRLEIAKEIVKTAIYNILMNLKRYVYKGKLTDGDFQAINEELKVVNSCKSVSELMGVEGRVREKYFKCWDKFLREGFEFEKRTRKPPENMLNALISFGNSLLYATTLTELYHTQLHPAISYLHEPGERRFSLALDISEVFKPILVDRVIFNLVNNRLIKPSDFIQELNSVYLNDDGKRTFVKEFQDKLNTTLLHKKLHRHVSYQRLIRIECYKLVRHILGERKYNGFKIRS
ncbi:MAG: type I-B CRISPR-associated endonuclease Cas1b [Nitrososphaerota archaeon]